MNKLMFIKTQYYVAMEIVLDFKLRWSRFNSMRGRLFPKCYNNFSFTDFSINNF